MTDINPALRCACGKWWTNLESYQGHTCEIGAQDYVAQILRDPGLFDPVEQDARRRQMMIGRAIDLANDLRAEGRYTHADVVVRCVAEIREMERDATAVARSLGSHRCASDTRQRMRMDAALTTIQQVRDAVNGARSTVWASDPHGGFGFFLDRLDRVTDSGGQ